jgi:glycosyltransferase involved in cell wall biosynthesis
MRILYHHRTLGDGAEGIHIRSMVDALRALGHTVQVSSLIDDGVKVDPKRRAFWRRVSHCLPSSLYEAAELAYNVVATRKLLRAIAEFQPDVIYDRYNSYSTAALRAGRRHGVPVLLEVNAPVAFERTAYEHLQLRLPWLARRYERWICSTADHVYVVSTPLMEFLIARCGVADERITVLPNGADPDLFQPNVDGSRIAERYGMGGRLIIGFTGILRPWHGIELLIQAFATLSTEHRNLHLLVVGDGPIQQDLEHLAREAGIGDRVTFTGRVAHHEVAEHVAAMDIAVSPRATFYASPMKILEYMAMGKAVIAPRMPNIADIIEDGRTGLLFEAEDVAALEAAIRAVVVRADLRRQVGAGARRAIETRFNWAYNARVVVNRAHRLLARRNGGVPITMEARA